MIEVIGVGADGLAGLAPRLRERIASADVVIGSERLLAELAEPPSTSTDSPSTPTLERWPSPLRTGIGALLQRYAGRRIVALASGDPLQAGVATTLIKLLGEDKVYVHPAISSVTLARARMNWPAERTVVVRLASSDPKELTALRRQLYPGAQIVVLSADRSSPAAVAEELMRSGFQFTQMVVFGDLGTPHESRQDTSAECFRLDEEVPRLHLICLHVIGPGTPANSLAPGLPDDCYRHDGQLTKRHVRATALAMLEPTPGQLLWDLGAGAGSIAIEWARSHPDCQAVAVERDPVRAAQIAVNAEQLGATGVRVVTGDSAAVLDDLPDPIAIFIGGGATPELISACWQRIGQGCRMVVHSVTLEGESLLTACQREFGGELFEIQVSRAEPLGGLSGWKPARAIRQWVVRIPLEEYDA